MCVILCPCLLVVFDCCVLGFVLLCVGLSSLGRFAVDVGLLARLSLCSCFCSFVPVVSIKGSVFPGFIWYGVIGLLVSLGVAVAHIIPFGTVMCFPVMLRIVILTWFSPCFVGYAVLVWLVTWIISGSSMVSLNMSCMSRSTWRMFILTYLVLLNPVILTPFWLFGFMVNVSWLYRYIDCACSMVWSCVVIMSPPVC